MMTLLMAGTAQFAAEVPTPAQLVLVAVESVTVRRARGTDDSLALPQAPLNSGEPPEPPSGGVPAAPVPRPTYDWRSPVIFDFP
jgi:hypothetical protein